MNLKSFRELFRTESGRFDLVTSAGADSGANFYINAAQRHLDRMMDVNDSIGRRVVDIVSGDYLVTFESCRSILEVWAQGTTSGGDVKRLPLTKVENGIEGLLGVDQRTLTENYTAIHGDIEGGWPLYYTPAQLRLMTDPNGGTGGLGGFMDVLSDGYQTYNGIVLRPPADADYSIEIVGNFYTMTLSEDTDSSFWSDVHPDILLMATQRHLEIMQRNTQGVADWSVAIEAEVTGIDMDAARQESSDITEMNG